MCTDQTCSVHQYSLSQQAIRWSVGVQYSNKSYYVNERRDGSPLVFLHLEPLGISFHLFLNTLEKYELNTCNLSSIWVLGNTFVHSD